jgi:hypothetical protein
MLVAEANEETIFVIFAFELLRVVTVAEEIVALVETMFVIFPVPVAFRFVVLSVASCKLFPVAELNKISLNSGFVEKSKVTLPRVSVATVRLEEAEKNLYKLERDVVAITPLTLVVMTELFSVKARLLELISVVVEVLPFTIEVISFTAEAKSF